MKMNIDICLSPLLYSSYKRDINNTIVIVADIFRATTTICVALENGARSIIPVRSLKEALKYKEMGFLVGGERNVKKFDFGDFGNSPYEYIQEKVKDKDIIISTTNGTIAIDEARDSSFLVIGAFANISEIAKYCIWQQKNVVVLCSGWKGKVNMEDTLFAGAIAEKLSIAGFSTLSDSTQIALTLWSEAKTDIWKYIQQGEHIKRLEMHNLVEVAKFCLTADTTHVLPMYDKETNKITDKLALLK